VFEEEWRRESYVLGFLPVSAVPIARSKNRRLRYCAGYEDVYGGPVLIGVLSGHTEIAKNNGYVLSSSAHTAATILSLSHITRRVIAVEQMLITI
jgi:hypothetical protein